MSQTPIINPKVVQVPIGLDKTRLDMGILRKIYWQPERASCHLLVAGQSGSGKTKFMELFASCCARDIPTCELFLADPKCLDFGFAKGSARFWSGMDSMGAIEAFKQSMMARIEQANSSDNPDHWNWKILVFDEVAAYITLQTDKKKRAEIQDSISAICLLGRGVRHVLVCGLQKALMEFLNARSQFGTTVLMGNTANDKEQVQMLMPTHKEIINETPNTRGQFWVTADGEGIRRGQVPFITRSSEIQSLIIEGLNRNA